MFCSKCGNSLKESAKFCEKCDTPIKTAAPEKADGKAKTRSVKPSAQKPMNEGRLISPNIALCEDGKFRWIYEYSLFKNPRLLFLIWKICFFVMLGVMLFVMIIDAMSNDMDGERLLGTLKIFGIIMLVMTALVVVSYLIYAAIMGGKYIVIFEMDNKGVNHRQLPKQARKAEKIAAATFLIGAASGNLSTMAVGMNARAEMYSQFSLVRKVKPYPSRNLIKVNGIFQRNQVFAHPEDFDFVLRYINERVPERARK